MSDTDFGQLTELLTRIETLSYNPETAPEAAQLSAAVLTVLGSGPSIAAIESMIAANQPNALMYYNAIHQQQITNILGMVAMMKCVQALLDGPTAPVGIPGAG